MLIEVNHSVLLDESSFFVGAMEKTTDNVEAVVEESKVGLIFADTELDINKTMMIRKIKKERKRANLTTMLKTVKRRKDKDLIAEVIADLVAIDKKIESSEVDLDLQDIQVEKQEFYQISTVTGMQIKRFNPEKVRDWDLELLKTIPVIENQHEEFVPRRSTVKRVTESRNSIVLLKNYLPDANDQGD